MKYSGPLGKAGVNSKVAITSVWPKTVSLHYDIVVFVHRLSTADSTGPPQPFKENSGPQSTACQVSHSLRRRYKDSGS